MSRPFPQVPGILGAPNFGDASDLGEQYEKLYQRLKDTGTTPETLELTMSPAGSTSMPEASGPVGAVPGRVKIASIPGLIRVDAPHPFTDGRVWEAVQAAARATGIPIVVISGFRTMKEQEDIYARLKTPVVRHSHHLDGTALDIFPQNGSMSDCDKLAAYLRQATYLSNGQPRKFGILWRVPRHFGHIHINTRD